MKIIANYFVRKITEENLEISLSRDYEKGNANLRAANKKKSDEFYTQLSDIENELKNYLSFASNLLFFQKC